MNGGEILSLFLVRQQPHSTQCGRLVGLEKSFVLEQKKREGKKGKQKSFLIQVSLGLVEKNRRKKKKMRRRVNFCCLPSFVLFLLLLPDAFVERIWLFCVSKVLFGRSLLKKRNKKHETSVCGRVGLCVGKCRLMAWVASESANKLGSF